MFDFMEKNMKLITIGTSHGKPSATRSCTAQLLEINGFYYFIDSGVLLPDYIARNDIPIDKIRCFFATHPHSDHIGCLPAAVYYMDSYFRGEKVKFILPSQESLEFARFFYDKEKRNISNRVSFKVFVEGVIYEDENVKVTAVLNKHMPNSYSFIFETEGKKLLISGDLNHDYGDLPSVAFDGSLDFILCECAHQKLEIVENIFPKIKAKQFVLTHIGRILPPSELAKYRERSGVQFVMADDGQEFKI